MESAWLQNVLDWVQLHPNATGWLIFLVALGESLLLVGILLPGAALLVGLGTLIGLGVVDFKLAWITASLGAFVGDGISFWIGHHYKKGLLKMWPMYKFPKLIDQGQTFFTKWGALSVFIGRFVGLVRPIIPAIAGIMNMPIKKYLVISTIAAILWAPFYLLPGMLFGSAMGSMTKVAGKLALLVALFVLTVFVIYWLIHVIYSFLLPRTHRILSRALVWVQNHPTMGKMASGLIDPRKPEKGSLAFMAVFILALTITSLIFILNSQTINQWSLQVDGFMQAFHTDWTQPLILFVLAITHDLAILLPSVMVFAWLLHRKRRTAAWHWAFLVLTSYLLAQAIAYFSNDPYLWFGFHHLSWFVAVISFWAALVSGALPHKLKSWPYSLASILVAIVAFAELFFMQMSLGVVLLSIFSAVLWASVVAIAYRMRSRKQFLGWPVSALFFASNFFAVILVLVLFSVPMLEEKPIKYSEISQQQWSQASSLERTDWLNRSKQQFSIKYQGDIENLNQQFTAAGWEVTTPKAWKSVWSALNTDKNSEKKLEMIPTTHNGKIESYILVKQADKQLMALHLWKEPLKVVGSKANLYSGYFSINESVENWGMNYWQMIDEKINARELIKPILHGSFEISKQNTQYFIKSK